MLHLVVHHPDDPNRPWKGNKWIDGNRLSSIETTKEVATECEMAKQAAEPVRFHRCAFGGAGPVVCSEARVAKVVIDKVAGCWVTFEGQTTLNEPPKGFPRRGTNCYHA